MNKHYTPHTFVYGLNEAEKVFSEKSIKEIQEQVSMLVKPNSKENSITILQKENKKIILEIITLDYFHLIHYIKTLKLKKVKHVLVSFTP